MTFCIITSGTSVTHLSVFQVIFHLFQPRKSQAKDPKNFHTASSVEFKFTSKFSSNIPLVSFGPTKAPRLILASLTFGNLLLLLLMAFPVFFKSPRFVCIGVKSTFRYWTTELFLSLCLQKQNLFQLAGPLQYNVFCCSAAPKAKTKSPILPLFHLKSQ